MRERVESVVQSLTAEVEYVSLERLTWYRIDILEINV